jgi:hypothetical protein
VKITDYSIEVNNFSDTIIDTNQIKEHFEKLGYDV